MKEMEYHNHGDCRCTLTAALMVAPVTDFFGRAATGSDCASAVTFAVAVDDS